MCVAQLLAEVRIAFGSRRTGVVVIVAVVATSLGTISSVTNSAVADLTGPLHGQPLFVIGAVNLSAFSVATGATLIAAEPQHRTNLRTAGAGSAQHSILIVRLAVGAAISATTAAFAIAASAPLATGVAISRGALLQATMADFGHGALLVLAAAAWAIIGGAFATAIPHLTTAVAGSVVWILVVENLLAAPLGDVAVVLPGQAGLAMAGAIDSSMSAGVSAAVLACWVVACGIAGVTTFSRRTVALG